jgi:putative transposase
VRNIHAHSIFDTKDRHGVFTNQILDRCEQIVQKVCTDFDGANYAGSTANTTTRPPTRALPPTTALSRLVNSFKGVSADSSTRNSQAR